MRLVVPILLLIALVAAAASLSGGGRPAAFTVVQSSDAFTLDPQRISWQHDTRLGRSIYETLVASDPDRGGIIPAAAERWECAADGRTWTFTLRADGRWTNGDPVTAHDFVAGWRRAMLPDCGSDYAGFFLEVEGAREFAAWRAKALAEFTALPLAERTQARAEELWAETERQAARLVKLEAVDDHTLRMTLARRVPYWLELVAFPVMSPIHRPTYAKFSSFDLATGRQRVSTDWTKPGNLVTNGPYQVVDWQYKKSMRLEPNPHHPAATSGMPASVEIVPVEDDNTSVLAFDAGGVDWLVEVRAAYKTELAAQAARYLARHRAEFDRLRADGMGWDEALCALPP
ncbi:MAG: ABC transporter substrate-binding protein, partial [Phycisphaerales bacterium]